MNASKAVLKELLLDIIDDAISTNLHRDFGGRSESDCQSFMSQKAERNIQLEALRALHES